jgi:hypothetical protein
MRPAPPVWVGPRDAAIGVLSGQPAALSGRGALGGGSRVRPAADPA